MAFLSIYTIFDLRSKIGCISEIQRKKSFPLVFRSICTIFARRTKRKKIMSIDTYKLTSMEEPTDEVLSQLMREAAEEARQKRAEATARFFGQLKRESEKITASC